MSDLTAARKNPIKDYFEAPAIQRSIEKMLGENAKTFITSVLQSVSDSKQLSQADPQTVFMAAATAAALNLPINRHLGFAYILPYNKNNGKDANGQWLPQTVEAQFQLGYRGYIQLAQRSGQMKNINACAVYDGDSEQDILDRLTMLMPPVPRSKDVIGYVAYFKLLNGFEAHVSMRTHELYAHALAYSQAYKAAEKESWKKKTSPWHYNFDAMAKKTVLIQLLSKQAPMSIDSPLSVALQADQAVIRDVDGNPEYDYVDNQPQVNQGNQNTVSIQKLDITNNDAIFQKLVTNILSGILDKRMVLEGNYDYILSPDQLEKVKAI